VTVSDPNLTGQRKVVDAFLTAARGGDFQALLAILDPDIVLRADPAAWPAGVPLEIRGAEAVAKRAAWGGASARRGIGGCLGRASRAGEWSRRGGRRATGAVEDGAQLHDYRW
jgi:hypothetical protein